MRWDPDLYHRFQSERAAPFFDLLALVQPGPGPRVIDLGCGSGELTARIAERLPGARVLGVDNSPAMLERARPLASENLSFELMPIETAADRFDGQFDVVFSNAAIQWVDDHPGLIPRLIGMLAPGGQIAIQVPANHNHPAHAMIPRLMSEEPFATALGGWSRPVPVLTAEAYAELLLPRFGPSSTVIEKIYPHVMPGAEAIADWTSGTTLLPYFERLDPALRGLFLQRYREALTRWRPDRPALYTFRRLLFHAGPLARP